MSQQQQHHHDLSDFAALGPADPSDPVKEEKRTALIRTRFPSTASLRWEVAFTNDIELLGRILRDILKLERATPGRHGPRPGLDRVRDMPALDRLRGLDPTRHPYSHLPFRDAFTLLIDGRSIRSAANKLGMTPSRVYRLKEGLGAPPSMEEMEEIAEAFDHHPSFFSEYRAWAIQEAVLEAMQRQPDVTVRVYEALWMRTSAAEAASG